jgi:hypothetical protein
MRPGIEGMVRELLAVVDRDPIKNFVLPVRLF